MRGTREGDEASRRYNAQLALHTLRFAINGNLRAPPAGFEDAIRIHFRLLRWRILRQVGAASVCFHSIAASVGMHGELPGTRAGVQASVIACKLWVSTTRLTSDVARHKVVDRAACMRIFSLFYHGCLVHCQGGLDVLPRFGAGWRMRRPRAWMSRCSGAWWRRLLLRMVCWQRCSALECRAARPL